LAEVRQAGAAVRELAVGPLSQGDVARLIGDMVRQPAEAVGPLGQLVHAKTGATRFSSSSS
jgi:predicted ATPase